MPFSRALNARYWYELKRHWSFACCWFRLREEDGELKREDITWYAAKYTDEPCYLLHSLILDAACFTRVLCAESHILMIMLGALLISRKSRDTLDDFTLMTLRHANIRGRRQDAEANIRERRRATPLIPRRRYSLFMLAHFAPSYLVANASASPPRRAV